MLAMLHLECPDVLYFLHTYLVPVEDLRVGIERFVEGPTYLSFLLVRLVLVWVYLHVKPSWVLKEDSSEDCLNISRCQFLILLYLLFAHVKIKFFRQDVAPKQRRLCCQTGALLLQGVYCRWYCSLDLFFGGLPVFIGLYEGVNPMLQIVGVVAAWLNCYSKVNHFLNQIFVRTDNIAKLLLCPQSVEYRLLEEANQDLTSFCKAVAGLVGLSLPDASTCRVWVVGHQVLMFKIVDCPVSKLDAPTGWLHILFTDSFERESTFCSFNYFQSLLLIQMSCYKPD